MKEDNVQINPELPAVRTPELRDIFSLIATSGTPPTATPRNVQQQIQLVVAGGLASLYIYDVLNNKWRAASLGT